MDVAAAVKKGLEQEALRDGAAKKANPGIARVVMQTRSGRNKVMVVGMFFMTAAAFVAPFLFLRNREAGKVFNKRAEGKRSEEEEEEGGRKVAATPPAVRRAALAPPARTGGVTNVSGHMVMPANGDTASFQRELSEDSKSTNPSYRFQLNYTGEGGKVRAMSGIVNKPATRKADSRLDTDAADTDEQTSSGKQAVAPGATKTRRMPAVFRDLEQLHEQRSRLIEDRKFS
jgi:hypothetical protein